MLQVEPNWRTFVTSDSMLHLAANAAASLSTGLGIYLIHTKLYYSESLTVLCAVLPAIAFYFGREHRQHYVKVCIGSSIMTWHMWLALMNIALQAQFVTSHSCRSLLLWSRCLCLSFGSAIWAAAASTIAFGTMETKPWLVIMTVLLPLFAYFAGPNHNSPTFQTGERACFRNCKLMGYVLLTHLVYSAVVSTCRAATPGQQAVNADCQTTSSTQQTVS